MFGTPGSRGGPGTYSAKLNARPPITRVSMFNGQSCGSGATITVAWDTLEWDDVGAWTPANSTVITTPPGFNALRVSLHTCWSNLASGGVAVNYRLNQNRLSNTTPIDFFLAEWGEIGNSNFGELGRYFTTGTYWPTTVGQTVYLQAHVTGASATFSPSSNGPGQAWMQVEWAYIYGISDTAQV